jgi:hypothetical protein
VLRAQRDQLVPDLKEINLGLEVSPSAQMAAGPAPINFSNKLSDERKKN